VIYNGNEMCITKLENKFMPDSLNNDIAESARTVEVVGFPMDLSDDFVYRFLENKRKSSVGVIEKGPFRHKSGKAIVIFEDEKGKNFRQYFI